MANQTLTTNPVTFLDYTDERKLDVYISSNLPTTQIYDTNAKTYSPDWSVTNAHLVLNADVYLDSQDVTNDTKTEIKWFEQVGTSSEVEVGTGDTFIIRTNKMSSNPLLTYTCRVKYNDNDANSPTAIAKLTFTRVDTGHDGADGTSVNIKGTATSVTPVTNTDYYTITYSDSSITLAEEGDAYVYNGDLYVCVGIQAEDGTDYFINVGRIQGPAGQDAKSIILSGDSQVFKVSTSSVYTPATIKVTAQAINTSVTTWSYSTNGGQTFVTTAPTGVVRNENENVVTITGSVMEANSVVIKASDGSVEDVFTVYKAFDGANGNPGTPGAPASMAFLTNENVTFGANANGQILATSFSTNVVAYSGTTKTTPKIGTISGLPTGMTATVGTALNNEMPIVFTIENNATLGSALSNNGSITIPVTSPVNTNLILTWSKVNSGAKGDKGDKGVDSYTVLLTNESHIFAGDISNAFEGSAETQILAYKGSSQQTVRIDSIDGKAPGLIDAETSIPGLKFVCDTLSGVSPKITFKCTTAFKKANGTIPIKLTVDGVQLEKIFTYSIAFKGGVGEQGPRGTEGKSMSGVIEYYLASASATGVTTTTDGWTPTMQTVTSAKKYLWNYEVITYNDGTTSTINPVIIGVYGDTGPTGKGVSSIVEEYYQSTSATAQSGGSWVAAPPEWANGKYIWTRSIIKYTDNTTSTTSPVCITGQQGAIGGTGIGVDSVDVWYYQSTSATSLSGGSWSTKSPAWADGKYIWTKTITTYTNSTTDETAAVCITGQKGATGVGIKSVTEYYLATSLSSGVTTSTSGWDTKVQTTTSTDKYLWNYEVITYTDNSTSTLTPIIIGVYGDTGSTGKGISGVKEYYLATTLASGVTTATSGWTPEMQAVTSTKKYLWNYEVITYTDNTTSTVAPILIGVYGDKGDTGAPATSYWLVSSASAVQKTSTGTITVTPSTLTFTGKSKTGTNAPVDYACRWIIAYSTDGTNYTNLYTSTANEASKSITVATTYKTIRARMYMAGGTTALLDEQIIPIISDGAKGTTGNGINSVTVTYGTSTAASTQPTSWQATIPTVAEGSYLWTRTITDYTNDSMADTVTYTYAKQGKTPVKGTDYVDGTSVTVSSIQYQASTSATTAPTGTWSNSVVTVAEGNYLWTKTTFSDGKVAYGVAKQGKSGSDAYTVILTNESHIFAGNVSSAVASSATTQVLAYKGGTSQSVTIVSVDGKTASTSSTATSIAGLSFTCSALSGITPTITFTCTTSFVSPSGTIPIVVEVDGVTITKMFTYGIAFKGATGSQGTTGTAASLVDITPSAHYFKSTTGKDGTFTPDYIYLYPRFQTVTFSKWEYSINGGTTWVAASGANGLTISTYNSVANTLRIARTSTLYTDTVTSISFRCVSSNSSVYDTVSIAKIYDVVDLQIGGRNLVLNSNQNITSEVYRTAVYDMSEDWIGGETYTVSIKGAVNEGQTFGIWANGSGTRVATLTYDASKDLHISTFVASTTIVTQTAKTLHVYNTPSETAVESSIEWIKLEKGNKATDWSPAPEDLNNINFQIYAPDGYLLTNDLQSLTLQTFAYEGSIEITSGATFQWSHLIDDVWIDISGATSTTLAVTKSDVLKAKSYRCIMTYKSKTYTSTITVQDKTDTYNSIMCISSNAKGAECYWVLHTIVYSDTSEIDPLLGPISINAPESPVNGDYWYAVDSTNATVQLKKYNGTAWVDSTDKQSLTYLWNIINDGSDKTPIGGASKVQVVSCRDFTATATLMCDVSNEVDGVLTQSSLSITDASDPIVSQTEPTSAVDGQIWIKPNTNGSYNMFLWSKAAQSWIPSDMDTRNKVYTSKPSSYSKGDIWITESDTAHSKYLEGTLLQATKDSTTYNEDDWSATLKYDKDIDEIKGTLYDLSQYVTITLAGLKIGAVNSNGELSPFTSLFTSTELAFYQNSDKLLTLANNQLTAPRIVVEEELEVDGKISLGNLQITIESNGSFSFAVTK